MLKRMPALGICRGGLSFQRESSRILRQISLVQRSWTRPSTHPLCHRLSDSTVWFWFKSHFIRTGKLRPPGVRIKCSASLASSAAPTSTKCPSGVVFTTSQTRPVAFSRPGFSQTSPIRGRIGFSFRFISLPPFYLSCHRQGKCRRPDDHGSGNPCRWASLYRPFSSMPSPPSPLEARACFCSKRRT